MTATAYIYFSVRDDNFTLSKKRVLKFTRLLREQPHVYHVELPGPGGHGG